MLVKAFVKMLLNLNGNGSCGIRSSLDFQSKGALLGLGVNVFFASGCWYSEGGA